MKRWIRDNFEAALYMILIGLAVGVYDLNSPLYDKRVDAKVLRLGPSHDKYQIGTDAWVELDGGRMTSVFIPPSAEVPTVGSTIEISHFRMRFFGDSFAYK